MTKPRRHLATARLSLESPATSRSTSRPRSSSSPANWSRPSQSCSASRRGRPAQHRMVRPRRRRRHPPALDRALAARAPDAQRRAKAGRARRRPRCRPSAPPRGRGDRVLAALIFSKYFYLASLSSYYTFYLIDEVPRVGAERADPPVHLPGGRRGRHDPRRPDRRPHRPQARDLGLDPRRAAVHAAAAARQPVLDRACSPSDRPDPVVGLLGDRRLRAGARARPGRHDLGPVLRLRVRHGRPRRGGARRAGRPHGIEVVYGLCAYLPAIGLLAGFLPNVEHGRAKL